MTDEVVIRARGLTKEYIRDEFHIVALRGVDLDVRRGEYLALMGPSGSGKSTLLHLIAAMDRPTSGQIEVLGSPLADMPDHEMARWRNRHIGFVFQTFNLIPVLTALENVELPSSSPISRRANGSSTPSPRSNSSASATASTTTPASCPAGRSSASPSPAPSSPTPTSSSATSPPATSTPAAPTRCSSCCASSTATTARRSSW